jgi:ubiquinol-cytochrome c reductase cytochrome c subunit
MYRMPWRAALAAVIVAVVPVGIGGAWAQTNVPSGDAAHGKQLFTQDVCYSCHGYVGQGSRMTGPRVARTQLPFDAFHSQIREPAAEMPPYSPKILTDQDIADIYAYLQSLPVAPNPKDIAILQY